MPIRSAHPDGTRCTHRLTTVGKATVDGCPGRGHFTATCSRCAETLTGQVKVSLRIQTRSHLALHRLPTHHRGRPVTDRALPAFDATVPYRVTLTCGCTIRARHRPPTRRVRYGCQSGVGHGCALAWTTWERLAQPVGAEASQ